MRNKITVIGAGNVGATTAEACLLKGLGDIVLVDIAEGTAKGKALDMRQMSVLLNSYCTVTGTADYAETADSDIIVVTAGVARKPGMSRDDLVKTNLGIVTTVVKAAVEKSPNAILVVVSNPLDVMCLAACRASGFAPERVIGLSGVLDSARLRYYLSEATNVPPHTVNAFVLGEHGDSMVPLPRLATIGGVPASSMLSVDEFVKVQEAAAKGGAAVVALMGTSAYYAPGYSIATMVEAVLTDSKAILPCSAYLTGQYGAKDMFMCVPVRLGKDGVEEIIEVKLHADETAAVATSVASIREKLDAAGVR